ncbi:MAG TPA: hypothetical protein VN520_26820 [Streptomyces sp.]|uniref:hypothetical protein n=1 Tax=Streptomyces sp. TaxID=1931 RepID=UPI002D0536D2|nr:hypothetical protein [Streptomyces sp.]HWU09943.1 hypothetical protein [Streptomyces sp.]
MRAYVAVEIDGVLSPYGGPPPAGHTWHDVESAVWREWAAACFQPSRCLRLALDPTAGRALAGLSADLVLVSSYAPGELEPLLPALGWDTLPPMVPLRETGAVHYLRADDPGLSPYTEDDLARQAEEIGSWAQTHDRPVAWVRPGDHHVREVRRAALRTYAAVGPLLPYAVDPVRGLTADDVQALQEWVREVGELPEPAPVVPRRCRDCGDRSTRVSPIPGTLRGRRHDRVHAACGSCCECYCQAPTDDTFQPCGDLMRQQCPACRCCLVCVGCHCQE